MRSIHARQLLAASLVLVIFLGLGALALDQAFKRSAEQALRERLQAQVYALLGVADEDPLGRMRLPQALPDPQYSKPDSGLYAEVIGEQGRYRWRSFSLVGRALRLVEPQPAGQFRFDRIQDAAGEPLLRVNFGLSWEDDRGEPLDYTLAVAQATRGLDAEIDAFRTRLLQWLGGVSLLLLLVQGAVLGWSLRPLRRLAADLRRVEAGEIAAIDGRFPRELERVVRNINALIRSGQASRDRYRNSLGDLAHSLKTPLTLLRGAADEEDGQALRATLDEQVGRMDQIIQYQLKRAAAAGEGRPGSVVTIRPLVERLARTLQKVYRERPIAVDCEIDPALRFFGDQADLMELLGNLMENGFKYGRGQLRVRAASGEDATGPRLLLSVEDNGPGIPPEDRDTVLRRGMRLDQRVAGQGIGLSVAAGIAELYGGRLQIGDSELGGAAVRVTLSG